MQDRLHAAPGVFDVVRCPGCGLVSLEPFPDAQQVKLFYPTDYYAHGGVALPPEEGLRRRLDDLHLGLRPSLPLALLFAPLLWYKEVYSYARFLRGQRPGRLLDVGCGDGAFLLKARRMGFECTGLEPGGRPAQNLAQAGIPVHTCALEELDPRVTGPFDLITLNHVFEHLLDPHVALERLVGLLAPGGRMLVRMPRTDHVFFRRWPRHWFGLELPRHVYLYNPENFARLASAHGLSVERVTPESIPTHLLLTLKSLLLRRRFDQLPCLEHPALCMALLPACALLKATGQADCMAVWLKKL